MSGDLRARLRAALLAARRARDPVAAGALRTALAAIENAEAVAPPPRRADDGSGGSRIAGTAGPLGAGEAPRAELSEDEARAIVVAEVEERRAAAAGYEARGEAGRAARLRSEADVLAGQLA
ncbi:MAG: hypothetical protein IRZ32_01595 [Solirubrobacteraceae bacterium]|nr:hypothetical protein [Solirubrobacteraceae bacterium]